jgi:2,4-dienoyl-CoA reductase-like NADH-dependent reductase (Old Yellow Enzyme family)
MYEGLAPLFGGPPSELHDNVYKRWGAGGWGMIITGEPNVTIVPSTANVQPLYN